ncbi:MAG: response regulator [Cyanobacteria bacterium]|nr:response regulator [Cyanobacteriota bacterium]MDA0864831.1 response regulator [Cyanobacteriota bacterium]
MRVLLIDDDDALTALLTQQLTAQNYVVDRVADGETGWAYSSTFDYDLIILDWMLPQLNGIHLCQRLRDQGYGVPILLLTAKDEQTDKVRGLEAGADDYVVKPFDIEELLARVRVLLRRALTETAPVLAWGDLCLDPISCEVTYHGQMVDLTAKEYALLELFLRHSHQVFGASTLLDRIWSSETFPSEATVRSHIRGLRRKLKAVGAPTDLVETVHGLGYRLKTQFRDLAHPTQGDRQARYLEGLTQAWRAHKGDSLERWNYLTQVAHTLTQKGLHEQQRTQAQQMAHSLAGTLGTFGLMEGYRLALQLEQLLHTTITFSPTQTAQFQTLVATLGHALDESPQLVCPLAENAPRPLELLILDVNEMPHIQQVTALAVAQGFQTTVAASIEAAAVGLSLLNPFHRDRLADPMAEAPDLVLVNLVAGEADPLLEEPILHRLLQFISQLTAAWPQLPVLVITPQADFGNRLDLIRRGGAIILEHPVIPAEVLEVITQATHPRDRLSKIMIVDDDAHHLHQVTQLLQPLDFQITPLTNPQRFWTLFTEVLPDLLILDIEMPHINGFELCQVLRSNPRWQHLPIVFLSIHSDVAKQNQAFALGADDYITKPIQGQNLVLRIQNRLKRYQACVRSPQMIKLAS